MRKADDKVVTANKYNIIIIKTIRWECKASDLLHWLLFILIIFSYISIKSGKVVILLAGRYAGRKAVVVKTNDEGSDGKRFGHAVGK